MPSTKSVSYDNLIVCVCGAHEYMARGAVDAALFRGELDSQWKQFLRRLEAKSLADELDLDLGDDAITTAAEAFRYEHDLITAEETEAWLATRGLTLDDFSDYFTRQYCASTLSEKIVPEEVEYTSASSELHRLFVTELILSGELDRMTTELIWRLAARCAAKDSDPDAIAGEERKFFGRNEIELAQLSNWLKRLGRDSEWFKEMVVMEAAYRQHCDTVLVQQARQRELVTLRLPLTRFETEVIELESRDAAKEALFCVREDGMSMEEVAMEGRYPYRRADFFMEDIPVDAQQRFLSASVGDVLEPVVRGDGFELCRIVKKIEPQPEDPSVRSRIEQRLLDRHFSELASKHVQRRLGVSISAE
ncbi:MAG TPA: hypothetical protein VFH87_01565 [Candidatus Udaeobacter sp.]|nr:hypothetical protein [Candidatus Udaeobacter sp.]